VPLLGSPPNRPSPASLPLPCSRRPARSRRGPALGARGHGAASRRGPARPGVPAQPPRPRRSLARPSPPPAPPDEPPRASPRARPRPWRLAVARSPASSRPARSPPHGPVASLPPLSRPCPARGLGGAAPVPSPGSPARDRGTPGPGVPAQPSRGGPAIAVVRGPDSPRPVCRPPRRGSLPGAACSPARPRHGLGGARGAPARPVHARCPRRARRTLARGRGARPGVLGSPAPAQRGPDPARLRLARPWCPCVARRVHGSAPACVRPVHDASARPCACVLAWCTVLSHGSPCPRRTRLPLVMPVYPPVFYARQSR
jgi:hypothetical protein